MTLLLTDACAQQVQQVQNEQTIWSEYWKDNIVLQALKHLILELNVILRTYCFMIQSKFLKNIQSAGKRTWYE